MKNSKLFKKKNNDANMSTQVDEKIIWKYGINVNKTNERHSGT